MESCLQEPKREDLTALVLLLSKQWPPHTRSFAHGHDLF